ncbi:MAG TPA: hypothetical protein VEL03_13280 [Streptosporangiaceae bacterium]|nr:hypothetical protein [Streptosporangiaceae bacterium]
MTTIYSHAIAWLTHLPGTNLNAIGALWQLLYAGGHGLVHDLDASLAQLPPWFVFAAAVTTILATTTYLMTPQTGTDQ